MKNSELQIVPTDYGIEETKANELIGNLPQIKLERSILEKQYEEVVKMDVEDPKSAKTARELRLKIRDNRTKGIEVWHKATKEFFLKGGQFIDAIKRMEVAINQRMEETLEQIEKYAEIQEQKRLDEIEQKRISLLEPYKDFVPFGANIRTISDDDFQKLLYGAKLQHEAEQERFRKEEEEIKENERLDRLARERQLEIAPYVQFLNSEVSLREMSDEEYKTLYFELIEAKKEYDSKQEEIRKENERLAQEKAELEEKAKKEREESERKLAEEREKQAKLEAELMEKKEAEAKQERGRLAEEERKRKEAEKLAKAPIKKKMQVWINSFELPSIDESNGSIEEIKNKFDSFKKWALSQSELF